MLDGAKPGHRDELAGSHGPKKEKGKLRLDRRERILAGGESGPAVVPGKPGESLLIKAVKYQDPELQMPPKQKLSAEQVSILVRWIELGAPRPGEEASAAPRREPGLEVTDKDRDWWSFRPIKELPLPEVKAKSWAESPVDRFVLAGLESKGFEPAAPAARRELIRRAYFDLIGLPPTYQEVESFVADDTPGAFERVIDRLLEKPQYGERWGRHWLDVARYSESNGMERNFTYPHAWRYRDYVIRAFNQDRPYDRFIREQLAGDAFKYGNEGRIGLAFLHLWVPVERTEPQLSRRDYLNDVVSVTGSVSYTHLTLPTSDLV